MELVEALFSKMKELPLLGDVHPTRVLRQKALSLIGFFEQKYRDLSLESVYGRNLAMDLFSAWGLFIDSEPDLCDLGQPEHVLLLPQLHSGGYGPFIRWLYSTQSDSEEVIVLRAVVDDRVAAVVLHEHEEESRKRQLNRWHKIYRQFSDSPKERLRRVVRDWFINAKYQELIRNDRQRMRSTLHTRMFYDNDGSRADICKALHGNQEHWLLEYARMYRDLAEYQEAFEDGRKDANELLRELWRESRLAIA